MKTSVKLLFTLIAAVLVMIGLMAITTETHTGYARTQGVRTIVGAEAVWFGRTCLLLACMPLLVWLPKRWVGPGAVVLWLALMVWIFGPYVIR